MTWFNLKSLALAAVMSLPMFAMGTSKAEASPTLQVATSVAQAEVQTARPYWNRRGGYYRYDRPYYRSYYRPYYGGQYYGTPNVYYYDGYYRNGVGVGPLRFSW